MLNKSVVSWTNDIRNIEVYTNTRPFSRFIQAVAERAKEDMFSGSVGDRKFVTVHLRTTDRPCMIESVKPEQMLNRMTSNNILPNNSLVFLRIDNDRMAKSHINLIRERFEPNFFTTSTVGLFRKHDLFKDSNLLFAVELELQNRADLVVESYPGHTFFLTDKTIYLAPPHCWHRNLLRRLGLDNKQSPGWQSKKLNITDPRFSFLNYFQ